MRRLNRQPVDKARVRGRPALFLVLGASLALTGCGGLPRQPVQMEAPQNLGSYDWRRHFEYGIALLQSDRLEQNRVVFARAAFASAARLARDHAPSHAGLGLTEMGLGNFSEAQIAFMNAALAENRSQYWALSALAALRNGDERVARTLFDAMQAAARQDDDPASRFIRAVYSPADTTYAAPLVTIPHATGSGGISDELTCDAGNRDEAPACRNLNVTASVYFVRRYFSDAVTRGSGFLNDLAVRLGASEGDNTYQYEKTWDSDGSVSRSRRLLLQPHLSVPDIQYALRFAPMNNGSSVHINATPSVITTIGETSEVREGSDITILFAGSQNSNATEYTAKTGTMLNMQPESATPEFVKLKLDFEFSSVAALEPAQNSQVLNVSTNKYTVSGHFPYGRPVVLGTISNGRQQHDSAGQSGLRRVPGIGGAFGSSREETASSETLVLGVLSEPAVFRGSHEMRVLEAMRTMGVATPEYASIRRRQVLYQAPDVSGFLAAFLREQVMR